MEAPAALPHTLALTTRPPGQADDSLQGYWDWVKNSLPDPVDKAFFDRIVLELVKKRSLFTVGCMFMLHYHEMKDIICPKEEGDDRLGWIRAIEMRVGKKFERLNANAPPSAALVEGTQRDSSGSSKSKWNRDTDNLGEYLQRTNQLHTLSEAFGLEKNKENIIVDCQDPSTESVSYEDQVRMSNHYFKIMSLHFAYIKGDKIVQEYLGKHTQRTYKSFSGSQWSEIYKQRMRNAKKSIAAVRLPRPSLPRLLPLPSPSTHMS